MGRLKETLLSSQPRSRSRSRSRVVLKETFWNVAQVPALYPLPLKRLYPLYFHVRVFACSADGFRGFFVVFGSFVVVVVVLQVWVTPQEKTQMRAIVRILVTRRGVG